MPGVSIALLAFLATTACGSPDSGTAAGSGGSTSVKAAAKAVEAAGTGGDASDAPDACSLLTVAEIKAATGRTYSAGEGTDYDNSCDFDTDSDRVTVSVSDYDNLETAKKIGVDVVPVASLPGATRVDAMVYVEKGGLYLSVGTGLPGFFATESDAAAAEKLATIAAGRL